MKNESTGAMEDNSFQGNLNWILPMCAFLAYVLASIEIASQYSKLVSDASGFLVFLWLTNGALTGIESFLITYATCFSAILIASYWLLGLMKICRH